MIIALGAFAGVDRVVVGGVNKEWKRMEWFEVMLTL